jgi:hypothetical protein
VAAAGVPGTDVVFFAHQRSNGGSAASEATNTLPAAQVSLLEDVSAAARAAGNKVVFVGNISLAVSMPWIDKVDAILWMWLGGDTVGTATAQLLTGVVNPSGKTTVTFPKDSQQSQFGNEYNQNGNVASPGTYSVYFEGIYGGYKWYDWQDKADGILFPFGYGLSYTTFGYSNLKVVPTPGAKYGYTVSVDVENTGAVAGGEAVQVYLSAPKDYVAPTLDRNKIIEEVQIAEKALVQFDKVYLDPGEKKTVTLDVGWEQLMYWDINAPLRKQPDGTKGKWQPVVGERTFLVGGSSANLPLSATVTVEKVEGDDDEFTAGITAPAVLDTVASPTVSYGISASNIPGTNAIQIEAKFDGARLEYDRSDIAITASYNAAFMGDPSYNAATGVYKATILLLKQGTLFAAEELTEILTVTFKPKGSLVNKEAVQGQITSFRVTEVIPPTEADPETKTRPVYATLEPSEAVSSVSNYWRFDVAGGYGINVDDISWIIYRYYLAIKDDANWADAQAFDANADGIVNLADILIISSYFTA